MYHYYNLYHHHHHHHSCHSSSSSSSSLSPSFVIVVVIIVVVVVVIYISIDRVFFLLLPSLFISDRHYDFFVLFHVHLSSRPNFKISTCLFLFFFFFFNVQTSHPRASLSFFFVASLRVRFLSPLPPPAKITSRCILHNFQYILIFLLTTFRLSYFDFSSVRTYFFTVSSNIFRFLLPT